MVTKEVNTPSTWSETTPIETGFVSKVKWFFQWLQGWTKNRTRAFSITRKESIVSTFLAIATIVWWCIYWRMVLEKYEKINSNSEALKNLSTYNVTANKDILSSYIEWNDIWTINWMIAINNNVEEEVAERESFKKQEKNYYEILLQNIYLPSLNIWKDPYTRNFDTTILGQRYLETDKFQDLYLIQYWSDFVKYVWNDADYNTVEEISIWDKKEVENSDYFYTPITITFNSPNKRSFLLLVNKLSTTSNTSNISLLNEFFFYLLLNIKEKKSEEINTLMQEYRKEFSSSSDWKWTTNFSDLSGDLRQEYQDKVIWYNLYHRINWSNKNTTPLIDDEVIIKTIRENSSCPSDKWNKECFYKFREKYRNLPHLAYKVWLEQSNRVEWLHDFLQDLPPAIAITSFSFNKISSSSLLNNKEEQYQWRVTFNAYWRNITESELEETSSTLWKLCFWYSSQWKITPDSALERVNNKIASLWWSDRIGNNNDISIMSLWELKWVLTDIKNSYNGLSKYNKMVKLFEIWRMLNDASLCSQ